MYARDPIVAKQVSGIWWTALGRAWAMWGEGACMTGLQTGGCTNSLQAQA